MSYGWRQYAPNTNATANKDAYDGSRNQLHCPSAGYLGAPPSNDTFSTSGGCVGGNIRSLRNRDNINHWSMCMTKYTLAVGWVPVYTLTWSFNGWSDVYTVYGSSVAGGMQFLHAC